MSLLVALFAEDLRVIVMDTNASGRVQCVRLFMDIYEHNSERKYLRKQKNRKYVTFTTLYTFEMELTDFVQELRSLIPSNVNKSHFHN